MQVCRIAALCVVLLGVDALRISRIDAPEHVRTGDTVTLKCEYDLEGGTLQSVKWYHNNVQFYWYRLLDGSWGFPEQNMIIDLRTSDDKQVTLRNVSESLSGTYRCDVSLDAPQVTTQTVSHQLTISKGSSIKDLKLVLPQEVKIGDQTAVLECAYQLDGVHLDKVTWYKDLSEFYTFQPGHPPIKQSKPLSGVNVNIPASTGKQVTLYNITADTAGDYRCQVTTDTQPPQSLSADGKLTVLKPKGSSIKDLKLVLPQEVKIGDQTAVLECAYQLDGVHLDKVTWYKDLSEFYTFQPGHPPIKQSKSLPGIRVDIPASTGKQVTLYNITVDTAGDYRCQVTTDTQPPQSLSVDGKLTVVNPKTTESRTLHKPIITVPENVRVGTNSITLQCDYDLQGQTLYSVKWYKNLSEFYRFLPLDIPQKQFFSVQGVTVNISASDDKHLTLTNITKDTADVYRCEVSSDAPLFLLLQGEAHLNVLDAEQPAEQGGFFDRAYNWLRNRWNDIKPK